MTRLRTNDAARRARSTHGPDFSEALARGLLVLRAFDANRTAATLSEIARVVDLPKATVRRALYTLQQLGYVAVDGRSFRLLPRVLDLAAAFLSSNTISTIVQPACERICATVSESCTVAVLDGPDVVMIARALPEKHMPVGVGIGFRLPAYCSSLGRVLLAALPDESLDEALALRLKRVTPFTIVNRRHLRGAILSVRVDGYSFADQEVEFGYRSIAVPLKRYDGATIAALNIGARIERATPAQMRDRFLPVLLEAASELRAQLI